MCGARPSMTFQSPPILMARALQPVPGLGQVLALVALLLLPQQQQLTRPGNHHHRHDWLPCRGLLVLRSR